MKYIIEDSLKGQTLSIMKPGLPAFILMDEKVSQELLKALFEMGVDGIKQDGSDNKK